MGKPFDKTMKNENETMENDLIMMIYIFFTIIKNELIFKLSQLYTVDEILAYFFTQYLKRFQDKKYSYCVIKV